MSVIKKGRKQNAGYLEYEYGGEKLGKSVRVSEMSGEVSLRSKI